MTDDILQSFPPVIGPGAHTLILGTMPGKASLAANQYYAHPRNLFWPIMGELYGAHPHLPYEQRLDILKDKGIALWDMVDTCTRRTSLDSDIKGETICDIPTLLAAYQGITTIGFNGKKSFDFFRRHYGKEVARSYRLLDLPSTSPAYASVPYHQKRDAWKRALTKNN